MGEEHAREVALTTIAVIAAVILVLAVPAVSLQYSRFKYRVCVEEGQSTRFCMTEHPWGYVFSPGVARP
jgi:hypothetical protein